MSETAFGSTGCKDSAGQVFTMIGDGWRNAAPNAPTIPSPPARANKDDPATTPPAFKYSDGSETVMLFSAGMPASSGAAGQNAHSTVATRAGFSI